ncbi:MAG: NAD-dependent epimerase/dehydratase family protein [Actinobacteria bacterium]|nr:NAD-dependent epimerase/dehydratase family protein [Actinomycetota bacterium]
MTGPTGDIGKAAVRALERSREVGSIRGMARRPFSPAAEGWKKTEYVQGDVLDRRAVDRLVKGADVVVHLAFVIMGSDEASRKVNLEGSRNVFEAAIAAGAKRIVYTSSVAAYGFRDDHPTTLVEDQPALGSDHPYSEQKLELEGVLQELVAGTKTDAYLFRPCVVAGPTALAMVEEVPAAIRRLAKIKGIQPVIPDPGVPMQIVHEDDVAQAIRAGVLGRGEPGIYNLAGDGILSLSDVARAYGWRSVGVPKATLRMAAKVTSLVPFLPAKARWVEALRSPMVMDTSKAKRQLRWRPKHDARMTLRETVAAARERGLL